MLAPIGAAQVTDLVKTDAAASDGVRLHRLDFASSYHEVAEGCFMQDALSEAVRGTMFMGPTSSDSDHRAFAIRNINWLVTSPHGGGVTDEIFVTGTGRYTFARASDGTPMHRMVLHVRVDDELVEFDSGLVERRPSDSVIDITVREVSDEYLCFRRYLRVASSRVSPDDVHRYVFGNAAYFAYQHTPDGDLLISPIGGHFGFVELPVEPDVLNPIGLTEWALVRLAAGGGGSSDQDPPVRLRGGGIYQHFTGTFTGVPIERMHAELAIGGPLAPPDGHRVRFDSGLHDGVWIGPDSPDPLPFFHIPIDDTDPAFPLRRVNMVAGPVPGGG